jgi:hypothetical protein
MYTYRCHLTCLSYWHSILVDTLDYYWSKVTVSVRTKHHLLLQLDDTPQDGTAQNETNTSAKESRVNYELCVDFSLDWQFRLLVREFAQNFILFR